jgi:ABC-type protease/lipase transport system fused ATPase/permease subunit
VLIAHDPSLFSECDKILLLGNGTQQAFGPRDEIWRRLTRRYGSPAAASGSLTLVSDRGFDR